MTNPQTWKVSVKEPLSIADVSNEFLDLLVAKLDTEEVRAIILKGSCARQDETPYSDVDLTLLVYHEPAHPLRRFYEQERLISISLHTLDHYEKSFQLPQKAIFTVPGVREARILLDKDGSFKQLQQKATNWQWEPLQDAANDCACNVMMELTEIAHKALRAFLVQDEFALAEMAFIIFDAVSIAIAVQRGILSASGNSYFRQVQESVGFDSTWTRYHRMIAGIDSISSTSASGLEARGIASLRLYQETTNLLGPDLHSLPGWNVIEHTGKVIEEALGGKQVS